MFSFTTKALKREREGELREESLDHLTERWLGIDFSGNHEMWKPRCGTSNVWIADVRRRDATLELKGVKRVQELPGEGAPFDRLASLLKSATYRAAGVDAPFSIPRAFLPARGHLEVLEKISLLNTPGRAFPSAIEFVRCVVGERTIQPLKPLRETEAAWVRRRVNARSTLWAGARGGAPMTSACLTLLCRAERPIWPWAENSSTGLLESPSRKLQRAGRGGESRHDRKRPRETARAQHLPSEARRECRCPRCGTLRLRGNRSLRGHGGYVAARRGHRGRMDRGASLKDRSAPYAVTVQVTKAGAAWYPVGCGSDVARQ